MDRGKWNGDCRKCDRDSCSSSWCLITLSYFSCCNCAGPYQIKSKTDLGACFEGFHWVDFLHGLNKDDLFSTHFFS